MKPEEALNNLQNEVWGSLDRYSQKLGWGLTGIQPECWTCLDSAVDELVKARHTLNRLKQLADTNDKNLKESHPEMSLDDRIIAQFHGLLLAFCKQKGIEL